MFLLTLFLIYLAGSLISAHARKAAHDRAVRERQTAAEQRQLEADRKAQLKAEQLRLKAEQAERKAEHTRLMAEQNIDSLTMQRQNTQALYEQIESLLNGNISDRQRITYTRQLMALDEKLYRLDNKIADLMYQTETA